MIRNDHYISKVVSACLMGDGFILKDDSGGRNRNGQFRLKMKDTHKDHLDYIANAISPVTTIKFDYTAPNPNFKWSVYDKRTDTTEKRTLNVSGICQLRTQNHPMFTKMRKDWYINGKKVINPHACTLIDAEFLAIWYQQDGYIMFRKDCNNASIDLCTDCFSYGDLNMIRKAIIEKTGFIFNIRKRQINRSGEQTYRLSLYRKQTPLFVEAIRPYVQPSFLYKIRETPQNSG